MKWNISFKPQLTDVHESVESSFVNRNGRSNRRQWHKQNTKAFLKNCHCSVCCPSYHQGPQALHIQLVDWGKTQAAPAANNVKLVSERHTTEVVLWCQKKSRLRHEQLTVTSLSSFVDPNGSSHWGSTHPKTHTHTPCNTHTHSKATSSEPLR